MLPTTPATRGGGRATQRHTPPSHNFRFPFVRELRRARDAMLRGKNRIDDDDDDVRDLFECRRAAVAVRIDIGAPHRVECISFCAALDALPVKCPACVGRPPTMALTTQRCAGMLRIRHHAVRRLHTRKTDTDRRQLIKIA